MTGSFELTTVAEDEIVLHEVTAGDREVAVEVISGLEPGTEVEARGVLARTLSRPPGELLCRFATVNDLHFGETECGKLGGVADGDGTEPAVVLTSRAGERPYPEVMNRAAAAEIAAISPSAVVAKGDLTDAGRAEEYTSFVDCYESTFKERLVQVRGNHDAMSGGEFAAAAVQRVDLPGVTLAVLDTVIEGRDTGRLGSAQLEWLDELGATADRTVLVFGHHHPWQPGSPKRSADYFGINPSDSEALVALFARRPRLAGWFAGHTHRNRVRRFPETGNVPYVEVASVKDFPGSWAEYRVFEGGILQVHRRVSTPEGLSWSDRCRSMFWGTYPAYALGGIEDRCFAVSPRL